MAKQPKASGIVSLRLSPEERQLVEAAAAKKGWKAATFLRVSALERAAHVLNLSRPTSFDFSGLAKKLAEILVGERTVEVADYGSPTDPVWRFGEGHMDIEFGPTRLGHIDLDLTLRDCILRDFSPSALKRNEVDLLHAALRLGGVEFAEQLVSECRRLLGESNDPNLPPPLDPFNLPAQEKA